MTGISVDEEGISPLERGRRLYQQKDYPGALGSFTEVGTGHFLSLAVNCYLNSVLELCIYSNFDLLSI
jgi:hypothetical protein